MPQVTALYRYPIKGFTPEPRESLRVQPDGRVAGDRTLTFRFANALEAEIDERSGLPFWPKRGGLALVGFPSLARLQVQLSGEMLRITDAERVVVEAALDEGGRELLCERVTQWLRAHGESRRLDRPGRLPLRLIGDVEISRFQDRAQGFVSLHGQASTAALDAELPGGGDPRRFRSNIVVSGTRAWEELDWRGRVRIGAVECEAVRPIGRCLATHANPDTGERDAQVLPTLVERFGQSEPLMGVLLLPVDGGGEIHLGDEVTLSPPLDRNHADP